jgi:hypothetical protein
MKEQINRHIFTYLKFIKVTHIHHSRQTKKKANFAFSRSPLCSERDQMTSVDILFPLFLP